MLTKIATGNTNHFTINAEQLDDYLYSLCTVCHDEDCNYDCQVPFPINGEECIDCTGAGRLKFFVRPTDNGEAYWVITKCGMCDGIGLV